MSVLFGPGARTFAAGAPGLPGPAAGFSPVLAGFMVAGGLINFFTARKSNKAIRKATLATLQQLGESLTGVRMKRIFDSARLATDVAIALGEAATGLGVVRGQSRMQALVLNMAQTGFTSREAIAQAAEDAEQQIRYQRDATIAQAQAQMQSPVLSLLFGAAQGAITGGQVAQSIAINRQVGLMSPYEQWTQAASLMLGDINYAMAATRNANASNWHANMSYQMNQLSAMNQAYEQRRSQLESMLRSLNLLPGGQQ